MPERLADIPADNPFPNRTTSSLPLLYRYLLRPKPLPATPTALASSAPAAKSLANRRKTSPPVHAPQSAHAAHARFQASSPPAARVSQSPAQGRHAPAKSSPPSAAAQSRSG